MSTDFEKFVDIVKEVRMKCPWDREQTHASLRHSFLEEAYEVIESIEQNDMKEFSIELGDILLHVVLQAVIAEETAEFTLADVIARVSEKLIRRHPHVFADAVIGTSEEQKAQWEKVKLTEGRESIIDGVPQHLPALQRAQRLQDKAAQVGFDWTSKDDVWKKVEEELQEFHAASDHGDRVKMEEEFGDLLFSLVNYSRFIHVHPEDALRGTTNKFVRRFKYIESELKKAGKDIHSVPLEEMDALWNDAKRLE
ncbi:MAG TPA: nucleoside triphosphate pyrophosphohydrolase [Bacteroidota bacterium]|nr:nucleoside triphosphate pyrophosphohydrolase [Bacteroidota bacterium]